MDGEVDDNQVISSGDIISFCMDNVGYLAVPSMFEPIPENEELVTHLRCTSSTKIVDVDFTRSMFRIELDSMQKASITYGSVVRIVHAPTNMILVCQNQPDLNYVGVDIMCPVQLRSKVEPKMELAQKWMVLPRYKYREEGNVVRVSDHIVLRSVQFNQFVLSSFETPNSSTGEHLSGLLKLDVAMKKSNLKIVKVLPSQSNGRCDTSSHHGISQGKTVLYGNDFIRLEHLEFDGSLICRVDDEKEISSVVAPLGSVCRKQTGERERTHSILIRSIKMQQPKAKYDFFASLSSLGIWQILLEMRSGENPLQGVVQGGSIIRLRHLISGQYLSIRNIEHGDTNLIKEHTLEVLTEFNRRQSRKYNRESRSQGNDDQHIEENEAEEDNNFNEENDHLHKMNALQNSRVVKIKILSVTAKNLKNVDWIGRSNPYLMITFGKMLKVHTDSVEHSNNKEASWYFSDKSSADDYVFEGPVDAIKSETLRVAVMAKHSVFQDTLIGSGGVSISSNLKMDNYTRFQAVISLHDKKGREAGHLTFDMIAEKKTDGLGVIDALLKSTVPRKFTKGESLKESEEKESIEKDDSGDENQYKENLSHKIAVATSSLPSPNTLFRIIMVDNQKSNAEVKLGDNVVLEHVLTKCRISIVDRQEHHPEYSKWWEYREDAPVKPTPSSSKGTMGSNVFRFNPVADVEVQDVLYAIRMLPLARAATATLQLTPSASKLYSPLFRHFKNALNTLTLWALGMTDIDGLLLPESYYVEEEAEESITDSEFHLSGNGQYDVDSDDEFEDDDFCNLGRTPAMVGLKNKRKDADAPAGSRKHAHRSSYSPWLGREVEQKNLDDDHMTELENYVERILDTLKVKEIPLDATIMRRQMIILDAKLIEQLMHFLNSFFILQRSVSSTLDETITSDYGHIPKLIERCCIATQFLLHACVYKNERSALKMLSVQGSFLSLISQKVKGWNPPIEVIMKVAFESFSGNDDSLRKDSTLAQNNEVSELDIVLMRSITGNDIRQILEQMQEMYLNDNKSAENILNLLTLLCQSGRAKQYFQNLLVKLLITCHDNSISDFLPSGNFASGKPFDRAHSSLLFTTRFEENEWQIQFRSPYSLPPQDARSAHSYARQLAREAECLKSLFSSYNTVDDLEELLDIEECFCLLEDLGFGGPFIYEEIGYLMGSSMWGFLNWWCRRASFFYPSTSVSQSQISPMQAMKLLGRTISKADLNAEVGRNRIDRETIIQSLRFQGIISSRIPGFNMIIKSNSTAMSDEESASYSTSNRPPNRVPSGSSKGINRAQSINRLSPWMTVNEALSEDAADHSWFCNSLKLLEALCLDRNVYCQRLVGALLPAEFLLQAVRNPNLGFENRHVLCDLLKSLYVDHDFVFPTRCIPLNPSVAFCGCHEELQNPNIAVGKVFNPLSRVKFTGNGFEEGSKLREQLYRFVTEDIVLIHTYSEQRDQMLYANSLLQLTLMLLRVGFFGEPNFGFFLVELESTNKNFFFSFTNNIETKDGEGQHHSISNYKMLERVLLEKLENAIDIHRFGDVDRKKSTKISFSDIPNSSLIIANSGAKGLGTDRRSFDGIEKDLIRFDEIFSDQLYNSIISTVMTILFELQDISQMMRVQAIWNACPRIIDKYSVLAYSTNVSSLQSVCEESYFRNIIDPLFKDMQQDDLPYVSAVFTATLHADSGLQKRCYDILNRRLNLPFRVASLLDEIKFYPKAHDAFLHRLIDKYSNQLCKYGGDIFFDEDSMRPHLLQLIDFTAQNLFGLLYESFLDKINDPPQENDENGSGGHSVNRFESDRNKVIWFYLTSVVIPCPIGEDDFFIMDVKSIQENPETVGTYLDRYSIEKQKPQVPIQEPLDSLRNNKGWKTDAVETLAEMTLRLFSMMSVHQTTSHNLEFTQGGGNIRWNEMTITMQFLYDKLFSLFAGFGDNSSAYCDRIFPSAVSLLLPFYPFSMGAIALVHTLIRQCSASVIFDGRIGEILLKKLDKMPTTTNTASNGQCNKGQILTNFVLALLESNSFHHNTMALHLMTANYEEFFALTPSFSEDMSSDTVNSKLNIFLKPIYLALIKNGNTHHRNQKSHGISKASSQAFKLLCNIDFCVSTLENPIVTLTNKGMAYYIACCLYDLQFLSSSMFISGVMEDLILRELRSLRKFFAISPDYGKALFENEKNKHHNVFQSFVFDGVLEGVKHRILETNILSVANVNGYIFAEIGHQDSKMVNKSVAKHVLTKLKTEFQEMKYGNGGQSNYAQNNDGHLQHSGNQNTVQPLPSACINIVMILFNIIAMKDGEIYRSLEHQQIMSLIWIVGALDLMLLTRVEYIYDYTKNTIIDPQDYESVRLRLHELLTGMLLERISVESHLHLEEFFVQETKYHLQYQLQTIGRPKSIRSKFMNRFLSSELQEERKEFLQSITIKMSFSDEFLISTAMYRFMMDCLTSSLSFMELEGTLMFTDPFSPIIRTKAYCNKFTNYSTFDIWSKGNGRYLSNLLHYLSEVTTPNVTEYNLIHLICKLTANKIESIRNNSFMSLNVKMAYVETETMKLRGLQRALYELGGMDTVIKVLGRCYSIRHEDYPLYYAPLILKMGSELVSWQNSELQNAFVDIVLQKMDDQKPPELDCINGLQYLIRKYGNDIIATPSQRTGNAVDDSNIDTTENGNQDESKQLQLLVLRAATQLFSFLGGLCQGDNNKTQQFLAGIYRRNYDVAIPSGLASTSSGSKGRDMSGLNICMEVAMLTNSILFRLIDTLTFIECDQFYDKLGPFVNLQKDNSKRRFFAWHQHTFNLTLIIEYVHTISIAFDNCISLCCAQSVGGVVNALPKAPALLEFLGLMQLTAFHKVPGSGLFSLSSGRKVTWKGGDPFRFYSTYVREMNALGLFKTDPEQQEILRAILLWSQLAKNKQNNSSDGLMGRFLCGMERQTLMVHTITNKGMTAVNQGNHHHQIAGFDPNMVKKANKLNLLHAHQKEFRHIFGISYELFLEIIRKAEYSCLRVILSCLEFTNSQQNQMILSSFHDGILIQNMGNLFHKMNTVPTHLKDMVTATTVSYISLIEAIGLLYPETNTLLDEWDRESNKKGLHPKDIYGCVEILGQDKRLRRVYFPVPSYVAMYWKYPEVQKTKDTIVLEVNRSSPEEKIADFLDQMNRISLVMKRQERLKLLLTYPIHALFGGKSFRILEYVPGQRAFSLALTFGLNVYFVYYNTYPHEFYPLPGIFQFNEWTTRDYVVRITQYSHLLLLASFALRTILNSEKLDAVIVSYEGDSPVFKILVMIINLPFVWGLVLWDCAWSIILVILAFFATVKNYWLYVPLLADVIFQFDAMYFLYLAIARNMARVGFTLLLSFLCLYFYAICAYLFIGNQYSLNDKIDCQDPGSCFKLHLDYGLANAPSWEGDGIISPQFGWKFLYSQVAQDLVGTFYNLTYVILINLVLQAIISGLIIDSFQSMREEKETVLQDIADKCFICSIPRDNFDQIGINFKTHIKEEHNMWHYAWFKIYLELKDPLSYSSTENFAFRSMQDNQAFVKMIPIKQSLTHDQAVGAAEQRDHDKNDDLHRLEKVLEKLSISHSQLSANVERFHRNAQKRNDRELDEFNRGNRSNNADSAAAGHRPRSLPSNK